MSVEATRKWLSDFKQQQPETALEKWRRESREMAEAERRSREEMRQREDQHRQRMLAPQQQFLQVERNIEALREATGKALGMYVRDQLNVFEAELVPKFEALQKRCEVLEAVQREINAKLARWSNASGTWRLRPIVKAKSPVTSTKPRASSS